MVNEKSCLDKNKTLLEETFYVLTKKNSVFRVKLTNAGLNLIKESENHVKTQTISLKDIIGCRCLRSKKSRSSCACQSLPHTSSLKVVDEKSGEHDDTDISAYLYIYAYILRKNCNKRERTTVTLRFRSFDKYEDNYKEAHRWRTVLKKLMRSEEIMPINVNDYNSIHSIKEDRRILVLVSPKSGSGKGRIMFQKKIVPILQEAEIPYDLHITKYANYAREFVRTSNIFQWTGIVVVGGDGLVYEVINGIFERWDWSEVLKHISVGVVPGGSGNGLARSIAFYSSEPYGSPTLPAALAAVRLQDHPMDLVRVETRSKIMFSFLSVGWGLLSDIDIESEGLRILGGQRFALFSVARLIKLRNYSGSVYYLPADSNFCVEMPSNNIDNESRYELPTEVHLETQAGRQRLDSWYSAASRRSAYFSTTGSSYQSTTDSTEDNLGKPRMYGPASQLPCLTAQLPQNWKCITGKFVMVHAGYQTHMGIDCLFTPNAKLNDGIIWLLIVHGNASRTQLLQFMLGLSQGSHVTNNWNGVIELIPVRAFRIEPNLDETGYMTVDGEHVEYGPIQAEVFPELVKAMVP